MKFSTLLTAAAVVAGATIASPVQSRAEKIDLAAMTCKQFLESGDKGISMVLTWLDGWYAGDSDDAIIDTNAFFENAKKFGAYCAINPNVSIITAAGKILGD